MRTKDYKPNKYWVVDWKWKLEMSIIGFRSVYVEIESKGFKVFAHQGHKKLFNDNYDYDDDDDDDDDDGDDDNCFLIWHTTVTQCMWKS